MGAFLSWISFPPPSSWYTRGEMEVFVFHPLAPMRAHVKLALGDSPAAPPKRKPV